jgi:hypothetical protein
LTYQDLFKERGVNYEPTSRQVYYHIYRHFGSWVIAGIQPAPDSITPARSDQQCQLEFVAFPTTGA